MATNDFKVFDENNQNVLSGEEYAVHDQRLNGVVAGMADSKMHNKLFKQTSTMAAAIGEALKDKGLDASDTDKNQLKENIKTAFGGPIIYISQTEPETTADNYFWLQVLRSRSAEVEPTLLKTSAETADGYHVEIDKHLEHIDNAVTEASQAKADDIIILEV